VSDASGNGNGRVPTGEMHAILKQALEDILPGMLAAQHAAAGPVPQVPAPPVAAVHRPSGWRSPAPAPAAPAPAPAASGGGAVEHVRLQGDRDLDAFVRSLAKRLEHPGERAAILAGRIRFTMNAGHGAAPAGAAGGAHRIERGAVTERVVERAAAAGQALVLGPKAVLTPMGRDRARALGVQIQRETAC
jgi:hypothetical protein